MRKAGNAPQNVQEKHAGRLPQRNASAAYNKGWGALSRKESTPHPFLLQPFGYRSELTSTCGLPTRTSSSANDTDTTRRSPGSKWK